MSMDTVMPLGADASFNAGIDSALQLLSTRINNWRAKRATRNLPIGVIEAELCRIEADLRKRRRPAR